MISDTDACVDPFKPWPLRTISDVGAISVLMIPRNRSPRREQTDAYAEPLDVKRGAPDS